MHRRSRRTFSLAAMMARVTSASNSWLAERLQMGVPGSVTQCVRRLRLRGGVNQTDLRRVLWRIQT
jgi:hypothetical protein